MHSPWASPQRPVPCASTAAAAATATAPSPSCSLASGGSSLLGGVFDLSPEVDTLGVTVTLSYATGPAGSGSWEHLPAPSTQPSALQPPPRQPLAQPAAQEEAQQAEDEEGLLSAEMSAELAALEDMQRQLTEQQQVEQQQAAEQQQAFLGPAAPAEGSTAATAAAATEQGLAMPADVAPAAAPGPYQQHEALSRESSGVPPPAAPPQQQPAQQLPWAALHSLLVQRGFPGLLPLGADAGSACDQQPDPAALFTALHSLLQEQARSAAQQQRLAEATQAAVRREAALVASLTAAARKRDAEIEKWKRLALSTQVAARDAQLSSRQCSHAGEQLAAEARALERDVARLQHALHGKDSEAERLKGLLAAHQAREKRRRTADAEALSRLKQAYAASKAADAPGGAAAALRAGMQGLSLKPLDLLRIFEAERANLAEVAAVASAEARAAEAALDRAREALHAAGLPCDRHDLIEGQARAAARQAAAAEERAAAAEQEAAALRAELSARPTQAQLECVQRQAAIMERQLAKAAEQRAAADAKDAKSRPRPRELSTREMIQRDRHIDRLGLRCVEELPKPVLVEVVQDACALLECRAPLELAAGVRAVQDTAALVPRMERFIGDVCGAVFQRGLAHVPQALRQDSPADVPAILGVWVAELGELVETRGVLRALLRHLAARVAVHPGDPPPTSGEVVPLVAGLVELERQVYHSREVHQAAEAAIAAQPDLLIHRVCQHFQRLFGCRSLEGILPAMNKVYAERSEAQTFLASLRAALGLAPTATLEACANALDRALAGRREALAGMLPAREAPAAAPLLPPSAEAVLVEVAPRRQELQAAARVAVERMAARRRWPQVQILVPAPKDGCSNGACGGNGGEGEPSAAAGSS